MDVNMRHVIAFAVVLASTSASQGQLSDKEMQKLRDTPGLALTKEQELRLYGPPMTKAKKSAIEAEMAKMFQCSYSPGAMIGLTLSDLRNKCGQWDRSNTTTTAAGRWEQLIYTSIPYHAVMYVYVDNGIVSSVQTH
jgi:hypothetical protein